jgi:alpha,alpha-trehalose phosphorylase
VAGARRRGRIADDDDDDEVVPPRRGGAVIGHPAFPSEPWAVRETSFDARFLAQSESIFALANGHLGLRGNLDEGEPRGLSGTYLNGVHESYPLEYGERGFGWPEDGQAIAPVHDGKVIRLLVEDEPFDVHHGRLEHHERVLDLRAGVLSREARWRSEYGRAVAVRTQRLVSFVDRNVAAISYEVEALEGPLRVALQSNLTANQPVRVERADPRAGRVLGPTLEGVLAVDHGLRVVLVHTTRRSGLTVAAGMEHLLTAPGPVETLTQTEADLGRVTMSVVLHPGEPVRLVKLLAYHWSSTQSAEWLRDQVDASLESALAQGFDGLAEAQRGFLDAFWGRADIELDGDPEIQQALRFSLFHVLQAAARAEGRSIPAKGLTGPGYDGHVFWDAESFVLPVLTYALPEAARSALRWRRSILPRARRRARELGLRGATLPWRTIAGEECSAYWPAGTAAFHVNADVALAVARYVAATGDTEFERDTGLELLVETARLWLSLGHHDDTGRFRIDGVTGPDEYSALVDNNVFTNLMAQANLRAAAAAVGRHAEAAAGLGVAPGEPDDWRAAADAVHLPYDEGRGIHPQDQDFVGHERWEFERTPADHYPLFLHYPYVQLYRRQVVKQPDLVLALHLRGDAFTPEQKRRDFEYYERITVRDSSLAASTLSIVAAEVGHLDLAYDYLAEAALMDLDDLERNAADGLHIGALAGAVNAALAGIGGMRDHRGELSFAPRLPRGLRRLAFSLCIQGALLGVEVLPADATYRISRGSVLLRHHGEPLEVSDDAPVRRSIPPAPRLEPPRQPPGREPARRRPPR